MGNPAANLFTNWLDGNVIPAATYKQEREILRVAIVDNWSRIIKSYKIINAAGVTKTTQTLDAALNTINFKEGDLITLTQDVTTSTLTIAVLDGAIGAAKLADGAVTTIKLADLSVTAAKIAAGTITLNEISLVSLDTRYYTEAEIDVKLTNLAGSTGPIQTQLDAKAVNSFTKIAIAGQADVDADSKTDTLNLATGVGITIVSDPATDTLTFTATGAAVPVNHALYHITGGTDVIPNAVPGGNAGLMSGADKAKSDNTIPISYGVTAGPVNAYTLAPLPALAAYVDGSAIAIKINITNTAAATINVNGLGVKNILDSKGNAMTAGKLKLNSIYTMRYNGVDFILQGEGASGNAVAAHLLSGDTASTDAGDIVGTMPNYGADNAGTAVVANAGRLYIRPNSGYWNGAIYTYFDDPDFVAANIKPGVNVFGLQSTMPNQGSPTVTPGTFNQTLAEGYYNSIVILGDPDLVPGNIPVGVNLFGVAGSLVVTSPVYLFAPTSRSTNSAGAVLKRVTMSVNATIKVNARIFNQNNNGTVYAQVYKNSVAVNGAMSTSLAPNPGSNVSSGNITVVPGDVIEWYMYGDVNTAPACDNFEIEPYAVNPTGGTVNLN